MHKHFRVAVIFSALAVVAAGCSSPAPTVATPAGGPTAAATQDSDTAPTHAPEAGAPVLPHTLYFINRDSGSIHQVYRMERDASTVTQVTSEPVDVEGYDVSPLDGSIAYEAGDQLILANADGSQRRVLVEGTAGQDIPDTYRPAFSPDGKTLAYGRDGLNLYDVSTGVSRLMIKNQNGDAVTSGAASPTIETYQPEKFSPDGKKLLVAMGHPDATPSHAVYEPDTNTLVRYAEVKDYIYCCSFHGGPAWSPDSASYYGVASVYDSSYQTGELWRVDAASGALTRMLGAAPDTFNLPKEVHVAPDGKLYFFFGSYTASSGLFDAPLIQLVRSAPDGVTDRTVLRDENFVLMKEALWAPDASLVIAASARQQVWDQGDGATLEVYYTDQQKSAVLLAALGRDLRWGP